METAGIGVGGTAVHTLLDETEEQHTETQESAPDDLPSSDQAEVEHDSDPVNDFEELPEPTETPLPTVEDTLDEYEIQEPEEEHEVHEADHPNAPLTEALPDDEETRNEHVEEISHGVVMQETDTEVNKEIPSPEEIGNIYLISKLIQ